ncbi:MAG: hypothetical protein WA631_08545 [Nitrososphaeraceae archaeon]
MNLDSQEIVHEFDLLENVIGLSKVTMDKAKSVVREANRGKLIRGRTPSTLVASAVYNPCRETNIPQTLPDIAAVLNVKRKTLGKCSRMLMNSLDLKVPTIDPFEYMMRLSDMINVNEKVKRLAIDISNDIVIKEIPTGINPMAVATSVLYIYCKKSGHHATQHNIGKAAGVTKVTLRNRFTELEK